MTPDKLRVIHILASIYSTEITSNNFDSFGKIPYEKYSSFPDFFEYLKGIYGTSKLPDEKSWNKALQTYDENISYSVQMIAISDPEYPKYLARIDSPPPVLYIRGNRSVLRDLPGVSVVGSREVTANGAIITQRISEYLAKNNWVIVSGLARGVDAIAHQGCLNVQGKTIAVLAHGLDEPQPKQNAELGYRILESGGAWVSEHPVGTAIEKRYFVQRNRIQLGLSAGSVIIEAGLRSGTMTQAGYCIKQRRPLFAVVPSTKENPLGLLCEGTLEMVEKMGAVPLKGKKDYPSMVALLSDQRSLMHSL